MWRLAAGARAVADFRFDDRFEGTGGLFCIEVNNQPGMTETSLVPELAVLRAQHLTSSCNGWWRTPRSIAEIAEAPS